ncbi:hypothetical protein WBJ53_14825 [Spirosoma sp. SC4-14]|uniref:hypothetical protein n=1 Tax=Spirosoma sp. SC4-14 TaxID=3128900 RepID=UPI0030D4248F
MEHINFNQQIDYKLLLTKYMAVITYVEGINFVSECSSDSDSSIVVFSNQELEALDQIAIDMEAIF